MVQFTSMPDIIRPCVASNWREMVRLRMSRHTHAGVSITEFSNNPINFVHKMYQSEPHIAVGCWGEDGKLASYICAFGGNDFWVLDLMISSGDPKQLYGCLDYCLEHFEAKGITQFYYAFPQKWARAYKSFWKEGVPRLRKYTIADINVIEAKKIPNDPWIWQNVLHEVVVPVPFLLRRSYVT